MKQYFSLSLTCSLSHWLSLSHAYTSHTSPDDQLGFAPLVMLIYDMITSLKNVLLEISVSSFSLLLFAWCVWFFVLCFTYLDLSFLLLPPPPFGFPHFSHRIICVDVGILAENQNVLHEISVPSFFLHLFARCMWFFVFISCFTYLDLDLVGFCSYNFPHLSSLVLEAEVITNCEMKLRR